MTEQRTERRTLDGDDSGSGYIDAGYFDNDAIVYEVDGFGCERRNLRRSRTRLASCVRCGALVVEHEQWRHTDWHIFGAGR